MVRRTSLLGSILIATLFAAASALIALPAQEARADVRMTGKPVPGKLGKYESCTYLAHSADKAFKNKDYRRARAGYAKAIEWMKRTCDATVDDTVLFEHYKRRAEASARLGDYEQAAHDIVALMKDQSAWFKIDNFDWMVRALDAAIERRPKNASLYGARAAINAGRATNYTLKNDTDRAKASEKLALADRDAQVKFARSKAERAEALADRHFVHKGNNSKLARADIDKAIELDPKAEYYWRRALFNKEQKSLETTLDAIKDISKAIELEPKRHWYYKMRAEIYGAAGDPASATESLTQGLDLLSPKAPLYAEYLHKRAGLFEKAGKPGEAGKDYAELVKIQPKNAKWRSERMLFLLEQGQDGEAEAERKEIFALDKNVLRTRAFVCRATEIYDRRRAKAGQVASPKEMRKAWNMGQIVALVPLRHLIGKQDAKTEEAWAALSKFVRDAHKSAGQRAAGLEAIPEFEGPKGRQIRQAIAFIDDQLETASSAVVRQMGEQAGAELDVFEAWFGDLFDELFGPRL